MGRHYRKVARAGGTASSEEDARSHQDRRGLDEHGTLTGPGGEETRRKFLTSTVAASAALPAIVAQESYPDWLERCEPDGNSSLTGSLDALTIKPGELI